MNAPLDFAADFVEPYHPLILALDQNGTPQRWIDWQQACAYYARDLIAWDTGVAAFVVWGGCSRLTGKRSSITGSSIIAVRGPAHSHRHIQHPPPLSNRELFHRDRNLCAYCGHPFSGTRLTRDHIVPLSRGGADSWMNVVTACRPCNQRKGNRSPEGAGMELLYTPFVPNRAEYLILCNRNILADQMDFLGRHVPRRSQLAATPARKTEIP